MSSLFRVCTVCHSKFRLCTVTNFYVWISRIIILTRRSTAVKEWKLEVGGGKSYRHRVLGYNLWKAGPILFFPCLYLLSRECPFTPWWTVYQGPVVQSLVSLTISFVVKSLTVLVSTIDNSRVFLLKNVSSFCKYKSYSHIFSRNINVYYAIFHDQSLNDTLTNGIISFKLGPSLWSLLG